MGLIDDIRRVVQTGDRVEREVKDPKGATSFLRVLPYRVKGAVEGAVLTLIDVSGLKAAEDALFHERYLLNSLVSTIPDAIYFKDARGKFIRVNRAMARRLGLEEPDQVVGKTPLELPNQAAALAYHREDGPVLESGTAQHYRLEKREGADGAVGWDLVARLPLRDLTGVVVGIIGIFRDVTEQKRAEEKIQEAVRRRDQFLAMLSHELRNPLGVVVNATSLLKEDDGSSRERLMGVLDRQTKQMARLLDDLLEVTRVTENKIELRRAVIDLRAVAGEAVESMRSTMEGRSIRLEVEIGDEPLWVDGDSTRLQQIHQNLLSNAAKYTPRGGHVTLVARREGGEAVVRVRDDGAGIAKELLESVFDLFVQAERTLDRSQGGLGVGLTLVRLLVKMHGGTVTASSEGEGKGAELVVRLPLAVAPPRAPGRPPPAASSGPFAQQKGLRLASGARIAVIEDNADSREMLCEMLAMAGFHCESADNGLDGVELIDRMSPDVAIVDVGLPGLNGLELAERVTASGRHPNMRLIALTGYGRREDRQQASEAGFHAMLVKPIDPRRLVRFLKEDSELPKDGT